MRKQAVIWSLILLVMAVLVDAGLGLSWGYGDYHWSDVPGAWAVFGLLGCLIIIWFSKWLGKHWLERDEDYYDAFEWGEDQ